MALFQWKPNIIIVLNYNFQTSKPSNICQQINKKFPGTPNHIGHQSIITIYLKLTGAYNYPTSDWLSQTNNQSQNL